jgi:hypothetical protein
MSARWLLVGVGLMAFVWALYAYRQSDNVLRWLAVWELCR